VVSTEFVQGGPSSQGKPAVSPSCTIQTEAKAGGHPHCNPVIIVNIIIIIIIVIDIAWSGDSGPQMAVAKENAREASRSEPFTAPLSPSLVAVYQLISACTHRYVARTVTKGRQALHMCDERDLKSASTWSTAEAWCTWLGIT